MQIYTKERNKVFEINGSFNLVVKLPWYGLEYTLSPVKKINALT